MQLSPTPRRVKTTLSLVCLLTIGTICLLAGCGPRESGSVGGATGAAESIENKGSDTLVNLALAWAEAYMPRSS